MQYRQYFNGKIMKSNSGAQSKICLKVTSVFYWHSNLSTREPYSNNMKTIKNVIKSLQYPRAYLDHSSLNSNTYIKIFMDRLE